MSTIPGGCFVAPDSLRRLKQHNREVKMQHNREVKMQQSKAQSAPQSPLLESPPQSPLSPLPGDHAKSSTFSQLITNVPMRLSGIIGRSRSLSSPQPTPPTTPPLSPRLPRSSSKEGINIPGRDQEHQEGNPNTLSESI